MREKKNVVKRCDGELLEWYYELGIEGNFLEEYVKFKEFLLAKITDSVLDYIVKYKEEKCGSYIESLVREAEILKLSSEEVMRKLRQEPSPKELQMLFYSP